MNLARRCLQVSLAVTSSNVSARATLRTLDLRLAARKTN